MLKGSSWGYKANESVRIIFEENSGGYEWDIVAIVRNEKNEYAVYSDSGCSCNGPYEDSPDKYDLAWTTDLVSVVREATGYVRNLYDLSDGEKAESIAELSTLRYRETKEN